MFERSTSDARDNTIHRCIAGGGCRAKTIENGVSRPALTEGADVLCDGCSGHHREAIRRLPKDYAMLRAALGEHQTRKGDMITSTRTLGVPIDGTSDRLMTEIVEWSEFAADIISVTLNTDRPDGERKLAKIRLDGTMSDPEPGSVAERSWEQTHPPEADRLAAHIGIVEPHLEKLASQPRQEVQIWAQPKRCEVHTEQVAAAKQMLRLARSVKDGDEIREAMTHLQSVYTSAGACDTCCGWGDLGQARQDVELSGLDVLNKLTLLHQLTRKHLGHTKLRHYYGMPCPNCGAIVGRDDGTNIVTCANRNCTPKGPSSWTEREYKLLAGMVADDRTSLQTYRYLLTEAYFRLDGLSQASDIIRRNVFLDTDPNAGRTVLDLIDVALTGHLNPNERRIASDREATLLRQVDEDSWAWKREPTYIPPKRKPHATKTVAPEDRITQSSRTLLTDTITHTTGGTHCYECNLIHAGAC